jgi:hypothetical protein
MPIDISKLTAEFTAEIFRSRAPNLRQEKRVRFHPYARVLTPDSSGRRDVQDRLTGLQDKVSAHTLGVSDDKVISTIRRVWAKDTLKKYSGSIERYKRFCASRNFDPTVCFPASEATLCAFAADAAGSRAASTIKNDLAGVRAWHIVNDAPFPSGIQLAYVLKGAENMTPTGSRKPLRPPMTLSKLLALLEGFDHNAPLDAAVFFAASAAFYGQLRLGERARNGYDSDPVPPKCSAAECKRLSEDSSTVHKSGKGQRGGGNPVQAASSYGPHRRLREPSPREQFIPGERTRILQVEGRIDPFTHEISFPETMQRDLGSGWSSSINWSRIPDRRYYTFSTE